jgi:RNA polymerase sigma-70 factor, ECF subfamily
MLVRTSVQPIRSANDPLGTGNPEHRAESTSRSSILHSRRSLISEVSVPEPSAEHVPGIEEIRSGEEAPFDALFRHFYPRLCGYVERLTGSPEVAEELVQEVFAVIWDRRRRWNPGASIDQYLFRAVKNRSLNYLRRQATRDRLRGEVEASLHNRSVLPDDSFDLDGASHAAQQAIDMLPERCRQIFLLSREGALTYRQIAELLGISVKTVETQMGRALRFLRTALQPYLR